MIVLGCRIEKIYARSFFIPLPEIVNQRFMGVKNESVGTTREIKIKTSK